MFRRFEADLSVDFREFLSCRLRLSSLNVRNLFSCFPTAHFLPLTTTSPARSSKFSTMFFPCINKCIIITISSPLIKLKFMKLNAQHRSIQNKWEKICFNNNNSSVFFLAPSLLLLVFLRAVVVDVMSHCDYCGDLKHNIMFFPTLDICSSLMKWLSYVSLFGKVSRAWKSLAFIFIRKDTQQNKLWGREI